MSNQRAIVPIYTSRGDAEAFLVYPHLHNRMGEWIGWVTADRQVYSVLGFYVGELTAEPRIIRKRITASLKPRKTPPARPPTCKFQEPFHCLPCCRTCVSASPMFSWKSLNASILWMRENFVRISINQAPSLLESKNA